MAYNVLKGTVDGSVDQHADQEIGGVKIFKNTISASVFYDTDAQSPCATMKDVAIKEIKGATPDGLLLCDPEHGARTSYSLTYKDDVLKAKNISAENFVGSAEGLVNIPSNNFVDKISADHIKVGYGIENVRGDLQVKITEGIEYIDGGIGIGLMPNSGLSFVGNKLVVDPSAALPINKNGQNLSDTDLLMISDVSTGTIKSTTLDNLYSSYINVKIPHVAGNSGEIQFKGRSGFDSTSNLTYERHNNTLKVNGRVSCNTTIAREKTINEGAVYNNILNTNAKQYEVKDTDYTVVCDTSDNRVSVILPPAQNNRGRIVVVKKANKNKYKINSHVVSVQCLENTIDLNNESVIKMNYSSRTYQSDGENWLIIGANGT